MAMKRSTYLFYILLTMCAMFGCTALFFKGVLIVTDRIIANQPGALEINLQRSLTEYRYDEAEQYIIKLEDQERKHGKTYKQSDPPMSADYRITLYELRGEYDKVLALDKEFSDKFGTTMYNFTQPRIHYLQGEKGQAFVEFCERAMEIQSAFYIKKGLFYVGFRKIQDDVFIDGKTLSPRLYRSFYFLPNEDREKIYRSVKRLTTATPPIVSSNPRRLYLEYNEFLAFIDSEYARLGYPSEYDAAVEFYHEIADVLKD